MIYRFSGEKYDSFNEYKDALSQSVNRYNAYKDWTSEEDAKLLRLSSALTITALADEFKRQKGAIRSRLKKLEGNSDNESSISPESFLRAILLGADPITGEVLDDSSAWKHPAIVSDIEEYINGQVSQDGKSATPSEDEIIFERELSPKNDMPYWRGKYCLECARELEDDDENPKGELICADCRPWWMYEKCDQCDCELSEDDYCGDMDMFCNDCKAYWMGEECVDCGTELSGKDTNQEVELICDECVHRRENMVYNEDTDEFDYPGDF